MSPRELFTKDHEGKTAFDLALSGGCDCCREPLLIAILNKLALEPRTVNHEDLLHILNRLIEENFPKIGASFIEQIPLLSELDRSTALPKAIWYKQQDTALSLIKTLPVWRLSLKSAEGLTALDLALHAQLPEVLRALEGRLPQETLSMGNAQTILRLYKSIEEGDLETELSSADTSGDTGYLALCFAIQKKRPRYALRLIEMLSSEQLSMQGKDIDGITPLHWAIHLEFEEAALALIDKLSAEQLCTPAKRGGQTALFWAINGENVERIALALIRKLPLNRFCEPENGGPSALFWALRNSKEHPSQALLLVEKLSPEQLPDEHSLSSLAIDPKVAAAILSKKS